MITEDEKTYSKKIEKNDVAMAYYGLLQKLNKLNEAKDALEKIKNTIKDRSQRSYIFELSENEINALSKLHEEIGAEYEQWVIVEKDKPLEYRVENRKKPS